MLFSWWLLSTCLTELVQLNVSFTGRRNYSLEINTWLSNPVAFTSAINSWHENKTLSFYVFWKDDIWSVSRNLEYNVSGLSPEQYICAMGLYYSIYPAVLYIRTDCEPRTVWERVRTVTCLLGIVLNSLFLVHPFLCLAKLNILFSNI